jgi:hypothetical protein
VTPTSLVVTHCPRTGSRHKKKRSSLRLPLRLRRRRLHRRTSWSLCRPVVPSPPCPAVLHTPLPPSPSRAGHRAVGPHLCRHRRCSAAPFPIWPSPTDHAAGSPGRPCTQWPSAGHSAVCTAVDGRATPRGLLACGDSRAYESIICI